LTSGITGLVTWIVSQNSASVELAKVAAESERLQGGNREEERRNRQSTYHQFVDTLNLVYQMLGEETQAEKRDSICVDYNHLLSGVVLFGPPSVREAAHSVNEIYMEIWSALEQEKRDHPDKPSGERWRDATADLKEEFADTCSILLGRMHADVTRGIAQDPEP